MLVEKIIEVYLRGPGPPSRACTPKRGYFHGKTKISKANTRVIIYCLKYCRRQCTLLLPPGPSHLQNITQIQDFKRVLNLIWK